jgi:mono/diheme cytochrome c family protein
MRRVLRDFASAACLGFLPMIAVASMQPSKAVAMPVGAHVMLMHAGTAGVHRVDTKGDPIAGRRLFLENNCYICHGGRGGGGMCPSLRDDRPDVGDVTKALENGTPSGMPSFAQLLTVPDMEDLAAYIDSLRSNNEPTFTHWWEAVPSH